MSHHAVQSLLSSSCRLFRIESSRSSSSSSSRRVGSSIRRSVLFSHQQHTNTTTRQLSAQNGRRIGSSSSSSSSNSSSTSTSTRATINTCAVLFRSKKSSIVSSSRAIITTSARSADNKVLSRQTSSSSSLSSSSQSRVTSPSSVSATVPVSVLPLWIVHHPSSRAMVPILGNVAYASLASGFLCHDVLALRLLLISGYAGLVAYHALRPKPLRIPLRWSAFFVLVNTSMAMLLILDRLPPTLTKEEEELHLQHFAPLRRTQFKALMNIATTVTYPPGTVLTTANQPCSKLFFIVKGTAMMANAQGKHISKLQRGGFPNCMSFQRSGWDATVRKTKPQGTCAYGTIRVRSDSHSNDNNNSNNSNNNNNEGVECLVWNDEELLALLDDGDIRLRFDHVVIEAVIRRLLVDAEGAKVTDYIRVISEGWADKAVQFQKRQMNGNSSST